jgi:acetylornithine deacetylase
MFHRVGGEMFDEGAAEALLGRLVQTPSTQTDRFESDPAVQSYLRETVAELAAGLGLAPEFDAMGNLVVRCGRPGAGRALVFAYAMTHPVNRMAEPFLPRVSTGEDGRRWMRGRGAAEQKAAVAAALLAAGRLRQADLPGELVVCVSTAGETGRHDAARAFMAEFGAPRFDWAVVALGTGNRIGLGNKGRIDVLLTVRGRAAHSSTPWAGVNAISGAVEAIGRLAAVPLPGSHPELGRPTLTVTSIHSAPAATHTVQDEVRLTLDRRLLPGDDPQAALSDIASALGSIEPYAVAVEPGPYMFPSEVAADAPLVALLQAAASSPLATSWSHGAIDAGYFNQEGVPAVMFGPGDPDMFHTDDERVALADVIVAAEVLTRAARLHLSGGNHEH